MALVLGMKVGQSFFIGDSECKVVRRVSTNEVLLSIENKDYVIRNDKVEEVFNKVYVSLGNCTPESTLIKVMIVADKSVKVLREVLYCASKASK